MQKIKAIRTADCVVGGFRYAAAGKSIGSLLLGLYGEDGLLHDMMKHLLDEGVVGLFTTDGEMSDVTRAGQMNVLAVVRKVVADGIDRLILLAGPEAAGHSPADPPVHPAVLHRGQEAPQEAAAGELTAESGREPALALSIPGRPR